MKKTLVAVAAFGIVFGFVGAAVVGYLRLHFYPEGFSFPVVEASAAIGLMEVLRESTGRPLHTKPLHWVVAGKSRCHCPA